MTPTNKDNFSVGVQERFEGTHLERHGESGNHVRASRGSGAPQRRITEAPAEEHGK